MRGRLIQKFILSVSRLDTKETSEADGYDDDYREVLRTPATDESIGDSKRKDHDLDKIPCQLRQRDMNGLYMVAGGDDFRDIIRITLHYRDLENQGLVADDGFPLITKGARIVALHSKDGRLALSFPASPGLYITKVEPRGWGIDVAKPRLNLIRLECETRQGAG